MASSQSPRPQIGIERLPPRRTASEPRELMNCKSCRKRKIKCNRLRPSCEACQVFGVPCIYDAIPKKRGPKTDVLEALLKRIDGLEKQLQPEDEPHLPTHRGEGSSRQAEDATQGSQSASRSRSAPMQSEDLAAFSSPGLPNLNSRQTDTQNQEGWILAVELDHVIDHLLSTYFAKLDGKPFYFLHENGLRTSFREHGISPRHLAVCALAARMSNLFGDIEQAILASNHYAMRARQMLDLDEPHLDSIMALILLSQHACQSGQGKKSYMCLSMAISMAFALEAHRESPVTAALSPQERDTRRMVFWACYILDRFYSCGSKRPCLIPDDCVILRLPSVVDMNGLAMESPFFMAASSAPYMANSKPSPSTVGMLVEVVKILGLSNRYLAAGGPKNDSHFPWHAHSMLSKIRQELDIWAAETTEVFASLDIIFSHKDNTVLLLSKLIYHLIHCLIYRPFLPVDLAELSGTSQHQTWKIEATKLCFLHANTIAELVEIWKTKTPSSEIPVFVSYCIAQAGSIHVHGSFYRSGEGQVFSQSQEFCSLELRQLTDMRTSVVGIQHQLDTLQSVYLAHSELAQNFTANTGGVPPAVNFDDFFDRYQGQVYDGAFLTLTYITPNEETSAPPGLSRQQPRRQLDSGGHSGRPFYHISYEGIFTKSNNSPSRTSTGSGARRRRAASQKNHQTSNRSAKRPHSTASSLESPQILTIYTTELSYNERCRIEPVSRSSQYPSRAPTLHVFPLHSYTSDLITSSAPVPVHINATQQTPQQDCGPQQRQRQEVEAVGRGDSNQQLIIVSTSTSVAGHRDTASNEDPFLLLLEQLAENTRSEDGQSGLDVLLSTSGA